uniref:DUF3038 domain-containing protein n=1 Tax=Cyanothece sp. (strain PCC 7425 / ATCC 29141) TaxID=395961 RepID=B8HP83_CYAP4
MLSPLKLSRLKLSHLKGPWQSPPPEPQAANSPSGSRSLRILARQSSPSVALTPGAAELNSLQNIKTHLDLILLALEALTGIGSEAVLQTATQLGLADLVPDRVSLWRLRQSNPLRRGSGGRKRLDVEEARSLVLISCVLAQQYQQKIRQAIELLEQLTASQRPPHQHPLLGDYLDKFTNIYQERMVEDTSPGVLSDLALKLLVDLLFYSSASGSRRLWLALLTCGHPPGH